MINDTLQHQARTIQGPRLVAPKIPRLFLRLNDAITEAHAAGDDRCVNLLLVAKLAAVRRYDDMTEAGR